MQFIKRLSYKLLPNGFPKKPLEILKSSALNAVISTDGKVTKDVLSTLKQKKYT